MGTVLSTKDYEVCRTQIFYKKHISVKSQGGYVQGYLWARGQRHFPFCPLSAFSRFLQRTSMGSWVAFEPGDH